VKTGIQKKNRSAWGGSCFFGLVVYFLRRELRKKVLDPFSAPILYILEKENETKPLKGRYIDTEAFENSGLYIDFTNLAGGNK